MQDPEPTAPRRPSIPVTTRVLARWKSALAGLALTLVGICAIVSQPERVISGAAFAVLFAGQVFLWRALPVLAGRPGIGAIKNVALSAVGSGILLCTFIALAVAHTERALWSQAAGEGPSAGSPLRYFDVAVWVPPVDPGDLEERLARGEILLLDRSRLSSRRPEQGSRSSAWESYLRWNARVQGDSLVAAAYRRTDGPSRYAEALRGLDDSRFVTAESSGDLQGYRFYLRGYQYYETERRHSDVALDRISELYAARAQEFLDASGASEEAERGAANAIADLLRYLGRTDQSQVELAVEEAQRLEPHAVALHYAKRNGVEIVPIGSAFESTGTRWHAEDARERIRAGLASAVGDYVETIPRGGAPGGRRPVLDVFYAFRCADALYSADAQKHLPKTQWDVYAGIAIDVQITLTVPGRDPFRTSFTSMPAPDFTLQGAAARSSASHLVYGKMAQTALQGIPGRVNEIFALERAGGS
ncbi:MAG: hypothetical protein AAF726_21230 [Planctomycetota bacterium]